MRSYSVQAAVTALLCLLSSPFTNAHKQPLVLVKNGTLVGNYIASYQQDVFLGIPYAQPPVGNLRFQNPKPYNKKFKSRDATKYSDSCVGYGNSLAWPHTMSEDCLTLNVVRPSSSSHKKRMRLDKRDSLPVGVWIHGGGWSMDYSANGVYNLTFMVEESTKMGKPFIAISMNYRLSFWGFMASQDILDAGLANLGLKDQRLALHWIKENIRAFGGDPDRITIFGESAGGGNVGYHATAFGGRDDHLFRGLIAQSGADGSHGKNLTNPERIYNGIASAAGCKDAAHKLDCLRKVPFAKLNATITEINPSFAPIVDGDFVQDYPSVLLDKGRFTKLPFLLGTTTDEGTLFANPRVANNTGFRSLVKGTGVDDATAGILMALYPDIDSLGLPAHYGTPTDGSVGAQYKRTVAFLTDQLFLSWRRLRANAWSKHGIPVYTYLFESPRDWSSRIGSGHFSEVGYVFQNLLNLGYASNTAPFSDNSKEKKDLAQLITRMWISFINDLDPNNHNIKGVATWPKYDAAGGYGRSFYLHPNASGPVPDTYRLAGTSYITSVAKEQFGR